MDDDGTRRNQIARDLATIYRLRGEFGSHWAAVDLLLDRLIAWHFGIAEGQLEDFRSWVLRRLRFVERIDIMRSIVMPLGLDDVLKPVLTHLTTVNTRRNEIAHSTVASRWDPTFLVRPLDADDPDGWYSIARRPSQVDATLVNVDELRELCKDAQRLRGEAERLVLAVVNARAGKGADEIREIIVGYDELMSGAESLRYDDYLGDAETDAPEAP